LAWHCESRQHPEQGFRACLGIEHPLRTYGRERLEPAWVHGIAVSTNSFGSVQSILQHGLDRQPAARMVWDGEEPPLLDPNIRGSGYYH
jgi:hypothetical protein